MKKPKVLLFDIETSPIIAYTWGLFDQNVALNQIKEDWHVLAWAAKWQDEKKVMYDDQRAAKDISNDKRLLHGIWKLLDEADVVITQNGVSFDSKKLNARFILNGMPPPSHYQHIDTLRLAKKSFAFTSNKLEYLSDKLNVEFKKQTHRKFAGFELWKQCLAGNKKAWQEMEKYNKYDVLSLEELYNKLIVWGSPVNFNVFTEDGTPRVCTCGSTSFEKNGKRATSSGIFQRYRCNNCGAGHSSKINELSPQKRKELKA